MSNYFTELTQCAQEVSDSFYRLITEKLTAQGSLLAEVIGLQTTAKNKHNLQLTEVPFSVLR